MQMFSSVHERDLEAWFLSSDPLNSKVYLITIALLSADKALKLHMRTSLVSSSAA